METQNKEYKKANVNFSILKSPKKTFVFYYKDPESLQKLIYKEFGYGKNKVDVLKSGTCELEVFLNNDLIEFAIVQTNHYNKFTPIIFGTKPQKKNKDYSIYRMYSESGSDKKFFKTMNQYWFSIFKITEISREIVEKNSQFEDLAYLADLLEIKVEGNTKKEEKEEK